MPSWQSPPLPLTSQLTAESANILGPDYPSLADRLGSCHARGTQRRDWEQHSFRPALNPRSLKLAQAVAERKLDQLGQGSHLATSPPTGPTKPSPGASDVAAPTVVWVCPL